jgi:prepilin-type N-terminal cleavage/methylation domain-containing protein
MYIKLRSRKRAQRGLTLIELLVFIVIVGIAATAILGVFGSLTRNSAGLLPEKQAQAFAASKLAEIMAQPFGSVSGYPVAMTFPDGTPVSSLPAYGIAVTVTSNANITSSPILPPLIPSTDRLLVTVVVTSPYGTASVSGIRVK